MPHPTGSLSSRVGFVLCRIVVPLWVLMGAVFKLYERTPANLPSQIWRNADKSGIDLYVLLATLISIEFVAVSIMFCLPRLARLAAIFMLSVFCLVLLNEMRTGNFEKCGCLGNIPITPWQMLIIDGSLLLGVLFFNPRRTATAQVNDDSLSRLAPWAAVLMMLVGGVASFGLIMPLRAGEAPVQPAPPVAPVAPPDDDDPTASAQVPAPDPTLNPNPMPLPAYITTNDIGEWIGKPWRELPLFAVMPKWPNIADTGKHYVVLYSRTCDHCKDMFYDYLAIELDAPVTALEIPAGRTELTAAGAWEMPATPAELMPLPLGTTWMITPPLAITIVDGKVTCAVETNGWEQCLGLQ